MRIVLDADELGTLSRVWQDAAGDTMRAETSVGAASIGAITKLLADFEIEGYGRLRSEVEEVAVGADGLLPLARSLESTSIDLRTEREKVLALAGGSTDWAQLAGAGLGALAGALGGGWRIPQLVDGAKGWLQSLTRDLARDGRGAFDWLTGTIGSIIKNPFRKAGFNIKTIVQQIRGEAGAGGGLIDKLPAGLRDLLKKPGETYGKLPAPLEKILGKAGGVLGVMSLVSVPGDVRSIRDERAHPTYSGPEEGFKQAADFMQLGGDAASGTGGALMLGGLAIAFIPGLDLADVVIEPVGAGLRVGGAGLQLGSLIMHGGLWTYDHRSDIAGATTGFVHGAEGVAGSAVHGVQTAGGDFVRGAEAAGSSVVQGAGTVAGDADRGGKALASGASDLWHGLTRGL